MTREIRVRAPDYSQQLNPADPDCYLEPDDPIHAIMMAETMGISMEAAQSRMNTASRERAQRDREDSWQMQYAREHNIKPGTVAWNALFGRL